MRAITRASISSVLPVPGTGGNMRHDFLPHVPGGGVLDQPHRITPIQQVLEHCGSIEAAGGLTLA